jgi:hypothetical protein
MKGLCMFKSQLYRAKATECGELIKSSTNVEEGQKFQGLEDRFVSLADNERGLADAYNDAVHIAEQDRPRGTALDAEKSTFCGVLEWRSSWNGTPYRPCNGRSSIPPDLWASCWTAALRGQIARFLHKHKNETRRDKSPSTGDKLNDASLVAAALSRWDNEGGAVGAEPPM